MTVVSIGHRYQKSSSRLPRLCTNNAIYRWYSPRLKHYQYIADPRSGSLVRPFTVHSDVLRRELPLMCWSAWWPVPYSMTDNLVAAMYLSPLSGCAMAAVHC